MTDYVRISKHIFPTVLAITASEQEVGLMGKKDPPVMSFIYNEPRVNKFWMHGTPTPLDIVFCLGGKITRICSGEPFSTRLIGDDSPSDLVIELRAGTCKKMDIAAGDEVEMNYSPDSLLKIVSTRNIYRIR